MASRSALLALVFSGLFAAGAVGAHRQASAHRSEAEWLMLRGAAEGDRYAETFEGSLADTQLATLDRRRAVLEQGLTWQRLQLLSVLASVLAAFASYIFFLLGRLRDQLVEFEEGEGPAKLPPRLPVSASPAAHPLHS